MEYIELLPYNETFNSNSLYHKNHFTNISDFIDVINNKFKNESSYVRGDQTASKAISNRNFKYIANKFSKYDDNICQLQKLNNSEEMFIKINKSEQDCEMKINQIIDKINKLEQDCEMKINKSEQDCEMKINQVIDKINKLEQNFELKINQVIDKINKLEQNFELKINQVIDKINKLEQNYELKINHTDEKIKQNDIAILGIGSGLVKDLSTFEQKINQYENITNSKMIVIEQQISQNMIDINKKFDEFKIKNITEEINAKFVINNQIINDTNSVLMDIDKKVNQIKKYTGDSIMELQNKIGQLIKDIGKGCLDDLISLENKTTEDIKEIKEKLQLLDVDLTQIRQESLNNINKVGQLIKNVDENIILSSQNIKLDIMKEVIENMNNEKIMTDNKIKIIEQEIKQNMNFIDKI